MKHKGKKIDYRKIIDVFVLASMIAAITFLVVNVIIAPGTLAEKEPYDRVKSEYILMLIQCILGVVAMFIPKVLYKRFKVSIPSNMLILYTLFLYSAIYLGEVKSFYYDVPHWDTILHAFSGVMLGFVGFSVINLLNGGEGRSTISIELLAIMSCFFSISMGVAWEIYEFSFDGLLGLNMQKFALENGVDLVGRAALSDTMKDLIVDSIGAICASVFGYISMKKDSKWLESRQIKIKK